MIGRYATAVIYSGYHTRITSLGCFLKTKNIWIMKIDTEKHVIWYENHKTIMLIINNILPNMGMYV